MTSYLDSHTPTEVKLEMLIGVQTGNDKHDILSIAHARTNRKDDIFIQRRLVQSFTYILEWGSKELVHKGSTHGAGYIPLCGIFFAKLTIL